MSAPYKLWLISGRELRSLGVKWSSLSCVGVVNFGVCHASRPERNRAVQVPNLGLEMHIRLNVQTNADFA